MALDVKLGSLQVDLNGYAKYQYPITVPPGIANSEPALSINFNHGNFANGILGAKWSLAGLSSIILTPPTIAVDKNSYPSNGVISGGHYPTRFSLDGSQLLCIVGEYGAADSKYMREVDDGTGMVIELRKTGASLAFYITNHFGQRWEYGTSSDSQITVSGVSPPLTVEWKLRRTYDVNSNYIEYHYTASPSVQASNNGPSDVGNAYLSSVRYTSNDATSPPYVGKMSVAFKYEPRPDSVLASVWGQVTSSMYRLKQIDTCIDHSDGKTYVANSYKFTYVVSPATGDSLLQQITQSGNQGTDLTPTKFEYSGRDLSAWKNGLFATTNTDMHELPVQNQWGDILGILPINLTGRGYTDICCVQHDAPNYRACITATVGEPSYTSGSPPSWTVNWQDNSNSHTVVLNQVADAAKMSLVVADIDNDGRTDIVVPFGDANDQLCFGVAKSGGASFKAEPRTQISTSQQWAAQNHFITLDSSGSGSLDLVHVAGHTNGLFNLYTYPDFDANFHSQSSLHPISSESFPDFTSTISWLPIRQQRHSASSLMQITQKLDNNDLSTVAVNIFSAATAVPFQQQAFSPLCSQVLYHGPSLAKKQVVTVLTADINGDGVPDVVMCTAEYGLVGAAWSLEVTYQTFLFDGESKFQEQTMVSYSNVAQGGDSRVPAQNKFYVMNLDRSSYPCIVFAYLGSSNDWHAVYGMGSSSGQVAQPSRSPIIKAQSSQASFSWQLVPSDITGIGSSGFLAHSIAGAACRISPIHNVNGPSDFMTATINPLGLRQEISYSTLTTPPTSSTTKPFYEVGSGLDWKNYSLKNPSDDRPVFANSSYLVSQVKTTNDPSINSFNVAGTKSGSASNRVVSYSYSGGKMSGSGRGWLGLLSSTEFDQIAGVRKTSQMLQEWPYVGRVSQEDIYGSKHTDLLARIETWPPNYTGNGDDLDWVQSIYTSYDAPAYQLDAGSRSAPIKLVRIMTTGATHVQNTDEDPRTYGSDFTYMNTSNQESTERSFSKDESTRKVVREVWKHTEQAPIANGMSVLPAAYKITSTADMNQKDPVRHSKFEYDPQTGMLQTSATFSSDTGTFLSTSHIFDGYGNEISMTDAAGLTTTTVYDSWYHTFVTKRSYIGDDVDHVEYFATDPRHNSQFAKCPAFGNLTADVRDEWGRHIQNWAVDSSSRLKAMASNKIQMSDCLVLEAELSTIIGEANLVKVDETSYEAFSPQAGLNFLRKKKLTYNDSQTNTSNAAEDWIDVENRARKSKIQSNDTIPAAWKYREYESRGLLILQSFPTIVGTDVASWTPSYSDCTLTVYDALQRPASCVMPPLKADDLFTTYEIVYVGDSAKTTNTISSKTLRFGVNDKPIESRGHTYMRYGTMKKLISQAPTASSKDLVQTYQYDALGRLTTTSDPSGISDQRTYNTLGNLSSSSNAYNNPQGAKSGDTMLYDTKGHLTTLTNAIGQTCTLKYDAKGRLTTRLDWDGRCISFSYKANGKDIDMLSSVIITDKTVNGPVESQYNYTYHADGTIANETLSIPLVTTQTFTTSYLYDLQKHLVQKQLPDTTKLNYTWKDTCVTGIELASPENEEWNVDYAYTNFTASGLPEQWTMQNNVGSSGSFSGAIEYDALTRPWHRSLSLAKPNAKLLVDYQLRFNALGQIDLLNEQEISDKDSTLHKTSIEYSYSSRRLSSSKRTTDWPGDATETNSSYVYDASGNMTNRAGANITYAKAASGDGFSTISNDLMKVKCTYDAVGRLLTRSTEDGAVSNITYDGFNKMRTFTNTSDGSVTTMLSDHQGHTIAKKGSDGSIEIYCGKDYSVKIASDTSELRRRNIYELSKGHILATVTSLYPKGSKTVSQAQINTYMTNHKGTITHIYDGTGVLKDRLVYDDFGLCTTEAVKSGADSELDSSYQLRMEANRIDLTTHLVDFNGRWYDPALARFTTPDVVLQPEYLCQVDGANLCAFECNDPINHIDPTGHWTWDAIGAMAISVTMIIAGLIVDALTFGLAAEVGGALIGGGVAGATYAWAHQDCTDQKAFWAGYGANVAIGMVVGFITAGIGSMIEGCELLDGAMGVDSDAAAAARESGTFAKQFTKRWLVSIGGKTIVNAGASVGQTNADIAADNAIFHTHNPMTWQEDAKSAGKSVALSTAKPPAKEYIKSTSTYREFMDEFAQLKVNIGWSKDYTPIKQPTLGYGGSNDWNYGEDLFSSGGNFFE